MNSVMNRRRFLLGSVGASAAACLPAVSRAEDKDHQQEESRAYIRCGKMCQVELRHYYLSPAELNALRDAGA